MACKPENCNLVFPISETECLGDSLSSINYNFKALDIATCSTEAHIASAWNPAYTTFQDISSKMNDIVTVFSQNSACWMETFSVVNTMSAFWLKPVSVIYPFPIAAGSNTNIVEIQQWLNNNLVPKTGRCFTFIVGQEIYVHVPEYTTVVRSKTQATYTAGHWIRIPLDIKPFNSIYTVSPQSGDIFVNGWCKGQYVTLSLSVNDQYIEKFVCVRFVMGPDLTWTNGFVLY